LKYCKNETTYRLTTIHNRHNLWFDEKIHEVSKIETGAEQSGCLYHDHKSVPRLNEIGNLKSKLAWQRQYSKVWIIHLFQEGNSKGCSYF